MHDPAFREEKARAGYEHAFAEAMDRAQTAARAVLGWRRQPAGS